MFRFLAYVFDFQLGVLAFFRPCDHDTTLQLPDDTSAKVCVSLSVIYLYLTVYSQFRKILRSVFELLPEDVGGEVALTEVTETATLSQHASAGFALSTVLYYLDKTFDQDYTQQHKLGDDCQGVTGTVTGGYLHFSQNRMYVFTEESGHYGRRWTIPKARERFAEFMEGSGLEKEYTLKPYFRKARESVANMFRLGDGNGVVASAGDTHASAALDKYKTAQVESEDEEWDFS